MASTHVPTHVEVTHAVWGLGPLNCTNGPVPAATTDDASSQPHILEAPHLLQLTSQGWCPHHSSLAAVFPPPRHCSGGCEHFLPETRHGAHISVCSQPQACCLGQNLQLEALWLSWKRAQSLGACHRDLPSLLHQIWS